VRVGITGHINITGETARRVAEALRTHLVPIGGLTGVTALAPGADTVFADVVLGLGGRVEVLLPSADYRQTQVGENTQHFDTLVDAADSVTVLPFDAAGPDAYAAANTLMLGMIDELVAVWDGKPAAGRGGTGEAVEEATRRGIPVVVIWPEGSVRG
jgi:hypothetical protein